MKDEEGYEKLTERLIQNLLVKQIFTIPKHVCVPNVTCGIVPYESDLIAITKSGLANDIEIKLSKKDTLRESSKIGKREHQESEDNKISYFWFAGPEELKEVFENEAPQYWGIILIKKVPEIKRFEKVIQKKGWVCFCHRSAERRKGKLSIEDQYKVARLGTFRIWERTERKVTQ